MYSTKKKVICTHAHKQIAVLSALATGKQVAEPQLGACRNPAQGEAAYRVYSVVGNSKANGDVCRATACLVNGLIMSMKTHLIAPFVLMDAQWCSKKTT